MKLIVFVPFLTLCTTVLQSTCRFAVQCSSTVILFVFLVYVCTILYNSLAVLPIDSVL